MISGRAHRRSDDQGGHLFATIFRGPGERINLVPMNANLNQGVWKAMENRWAEALSQVRQVEVEVDVVYEDVSTSLLEIIPDGSAKIIASSWVGDDWAKTKIRFEDASRKRWSLCFEGCTEAGDR